jgi:serine protease AprX
VSQVIAAIDWIVTYGRTNGLNVRVINLSYGTNSAQAWQLDPLSYAAQIAMSAGYVMVVAAGNDGTTATELANPAMNPNILAVGAIDYNDSFDSSQWTVADFASRGSALRSPDMVMPGAHIIGLRVDGSFATTYFPGGMVGDRFIRGSGTSQAAALASGMAALLISKAPGAKPKDVKTILMAASTAVNGASHYQGSGVIDIEGILEQADQLAALLKVTSSTTTAWNGVHGTGSVAAARGPVTLTSVEVPLLGDIDIFGRPFASATWAKAAAAKKAWVGSSWMGVPMASYVKSKWSPTVWGHSSWTGARWSALGWVTDEWSSGSLTGARWSTGNWTGDSWAGARWSGARWSGARWSGARWSGARWSNGSWESTNWASAGWD